MPRLPLACLLAFGWASLSASEPFSEAREPVHADFTSHSLVLRDGAILAYYTKTGRGPTVVLIPGTHGDRSRFLGQGFVDHLRPDLGVIIVENRGQGRSWPPPSPERANMEDYATDVMEVVNRAAPAAWYVSGHSLGGMIAIEVAGRKPPGLKGVIPLEGWPHHTVENDAFPPLVPKTEAQREEDRRWRQERYARLRWTPEEFARLQQIWRNWTPGAAILRETTYPVLTIWGDRDLPRRPGRELLQLPETPNVEVAWIKGSGHNVMDAKHAGEVARLMNAFITRTEKD